MMKSKQNRIFISYASEDLAKVKKVYQGLIKRKCDVWFDQESLLPGNWKPQILKAISRSRYFLIFLSKAALKKTGDIEPGFQDEELNYAYQIAMNQSDQNFTIIPIRLEDCDRGDFRTSVYQQYNLFEDYEKTLDMLSIHLGGVPNSNIKTEDERTEDDKIVDSLISKSIATYYAKEYENAIKILESVLIISQHNYNALSVKGVILFELKYFEDALNLVNLALKTHKKDIFFETLKIALLWQLDRKKDAFEAEFKIFTTNWQTRSAHFHDGVVRPDSGFYKEDIGQNLMIQEKLKSTNPLSYLWLRKTEILTHLERPTEGLKTCDEAISLFPDNPILFVAKASLLIHLERLHEAVETIENGLLLHPYFSPLWKQRMVLLGMGYCDSKLLQTCDDAISKCPENFLIWVVKAALLNRLDRKKECRNVIEESLSIFPENTILLNLKIDFLTSDGHLEEALIICDKALSDNPDNTYLLERKDTILMLLGRDEEDEDVWDVREKMYAASYLGLWAPFRKFDVKRERFEEAIDICESILAIMPGNPLLSQIKAKALINLDRKAEAIDAYDQAIIDSPQKENILFEKSKLMALCGKFDEALSIIDEAILNSPLDLRFWEHRKFILFSLDRTDEELCFLEKFLSDNQNNQELILFKINTLIEKEQFQEALDCCNGALSIDSNNFLFWLSKVSIYLKEGLLEKALNVCDEAISMITGDYGNIRKNGTGAYGP